MATVESTSSATRRAMTQTTRRICASFYYSPNSFRDVLDLLLTDQHRFIVQNEDVDTQLVLAHAEAGARYTVRRHMVILAAGYAGIAATSLLLSSIEFFVAASLLSIPALLLLRLCFSYLLGAFSDGVNFGRLLVIAVFGVLVVPILLVLSVSLVFLILPLFLALLTSYIQVWQIHRTKLGGFSESQWSPEPPPVEVGEVAAAIDRLRSETLDGNATVYSGFDPFVGAGENIGRWEQAIKLERDDASEGKSPAEQLDGQQLVSRMYPSLKAFGGERLTARRWYFVPGERATYIPGMVVDPHSRPIGRVEVSTPGQEKISEETARWYLWLTSVRWDGELVLNSFFRVKILDTVAFVEIVHFVVGPLLPSFVRADLDYSSPDFSTYREFAAMAAVRVWNLPSDLIWWLTRGRRWRIGRRSLDQTRRLGISPDYGARHSVREFFSGRYYEYYFQKMDAIEHSKSIDLQAFLALDEALGEFGYQIAMRDQVVQNLTSIAVGGDFNVSGNSTVGSGNMASAGSSASGSS